MRKSTIAQIAGLTGGVAALGAAAYAYTHRDEPRREVSLRQARRIGESLGIDWTRFDPEELRRGMEVELEHGRRDPATDVTGDDLLLTGKIALAHLNEFPDYYARLSRMEAQARAYWEGEGGEAVEDELPA
jgi:hypothetical protein